MFDRSKEVLIQGEVSEWRWSNPHSWLHVNVKNADGTTTEWMVEGATPNTLLRRGFTRDTVKAGTEITIVGYQAKSGENKAVAVFFEYPDGRKVFMGGSAPGADGKPVPTGGTAQR
jgi:hypothetical protein